jgi:hypothetical protein
MDVSGYVGVRNKYTGSFWSTPMGLIVAYMWANVGMFQAGECAVVSGIISTEAPNNSKKQIAIAKYTLLKKFVCISFLFS